MLNHHDDINNDEWTWNVYVWATSNKFRIIQDMPISKDSKAQVTEVMKLNEFIDIKYKR